MSPDLKSISPIDNRKAKQISGFQRVTLLISCIVILVAVYNLFQPMNISGSSTPTSAGEMFTTSNLANVGFIAAALLTMVFSLSAGGVFRTLSMLVSLVLAAGAVAAAYIYLNTDVQLLQLNSSFAFFLLGTALFSVCMRWYYLSQSLVITLVAVQFLSLFGYIHEMPEFYVPFPNSLASLPETLSFLFLSLGTLFASADKGYMADITSNYSGGKIARRLFPMLLIAPFVLESMRIYGENKGIYSSPFGIVLFFCAVLGITLFMILNSVKLANKIDTALELEIEERRKAEKELRNSNRFLETIVENIPNMIFVKKGEELRFHSINKAGERLLKIPREKYIGKTDEDLFPPEQANFFKTKDREVYKKNTVLEIEEPVDTPDGTIWLRTKKFPINDENGKPLYLVGVSEDVTKKREQEEQIKQFYSELEEKVIIRTQELSNSEKRFRALIENSTDGITLTDEDYVIIYESPAVRRMAGDLYAGRIGSSIFQHIHPEDVPRCRAYIDEINDNPGHPVFVQYRMKDSDGNYLWVEGTATNLLQDESVRATILNYRDVTDRKKHEQERELLIQELTRHNKDLRQFSYITSHNLRAPLSNLLGLLSLIQFIKIDDPALKDILKGFDVSTNSLNDTINDLLHILYVKENVAIAQEDVAVTPLLNKVINQVSNLIQEVDPELITNLGDEHIIHFNRAYLESIFLNLLTNAIKYRSTSRRLKIQILLEELEDKTLLTFEDNGIGLDLEKCRSKVFGLYQRFHNHPDSKGLGLYLVKTQIEALGGTIDIESEVEKGTKFILTFNKTYAGQSFIH